MEIEQLKEMAILYRNNARYRMVDFMQKLIYLEEVCMNYQLKVIECLKVPDFLTAC